MSERLYALLADFDTPEALVVAAERAFAAGYRRMDAFSPFPVEGLSEALGQRPSRVPAIVLIAGILGGAGGYLMQYWMNAFDYALNIGGRPPHSWPAFIPVTFEMTVLIAAVVGVIGMFALNRLPMPYHPVFNAPHFDRATHDRFFLAIEADDPQFDREKTAAFLASLGAIQVAEAPE